MGSIEVGGGGGGERRVVTQIMLYFPLVSAAYIFVVVYF
jgi:hypothetical protein